LFKIASLAQKEIIQTLKQNGLCRDLDYKNIWQILPIMCSGIVGNPHDEQDFHLF